jgi:UDP-glucose-4-epimerase GalE
MRVLVTGGAGYVGSHAAWRLAASGHSPIVVDDLSTGHASMVRWGPLVRASLCDPSTVAALFREHRPEAVLHFAGRSLVAESVADPRPYFHDNLVAALHILDAMRAHGTRWLVFSSTAAVYGAPREVPIPEDHPPLPQSPYGHSKLAIERMLEAYDHAYGLRYAALRYFNAAGAAPDQGLGELHTPETHLVPLVLAVAHGQRTAVDVFGRDYDTPDGTCLRDYIHVTDLADAHVAALDWLAQGGVSLIANLGTGAGRSVLEVVDRARAVTGHAIPTVDRPRRAGDPPALVARTERARQILGWRPRYDLDAMIESAWQFRRRATG